MLYRMARPGWRLLKLEPNNAPADTPTMLSKSMPASSRTSKTPLVNMPLIPPPSSTSPVFSCFIVLFFGAFSFSGNQRVLIVC